MAEEDNISMRHNSLKLDAGMSPWSQLKTHIGQKSNPYELELNQSITDSAPDKTSIEQDLESKQSCDLERTGKADTPASSNLSERHENESRSAGGLSVEICSGGDEEEEDCDTFLVAQDYLFQKLNLFEEDQEQDKGVPPEKIVHRIKSKNDMKSYQLGKQLTFQWTTGAGPRIGCVRDYPTELQFRALEEVNLSPRSRRHCRSFSSPLNSISRSPRSPVTSPLIQSNHITSGRISNCTTLS